MNRDTIRQKIVLGTNEIRLYDRFGDKIKLGASASFLHLLKSLVELSGMRASGRLPHGFLIGRRIRRWSLPELINHSKELQAAFLPLAKSDSEAANDNEPD